MVEHEILLFAGLRERHGTDRVVVRLPRGATVADLRRAVCEAAPALEGHVAHSRIAVGQAFVDDESQTLRPGEEIALIPPVSGGHGGAVVKVTDAPLSLEDVVAVVRHRDAGGIATFTGNVRGHSRGQEIEHLEYEAYVPMAERVMHDIVARLQNDVDGVRVAIHHRIGRLQVGETAVVIAASAPHRAQAFEACREAIEALKRDVPIWKREVSTQGAVWIGRGP